MDYADAVEYADDIIDHEESVPFEILRRTEDEVQVFEVHGDLDMSTTPQLWDELKALPADTAVRLDLSSVAFIDSVGLKVLLSAQQRFGDGLTLSATPEHIVNLLTLVGVKKLLHLVP